METMRVLLVEDEAESMDLLQETLHCLGGMPLHVLVAHNGREAWDVLRKEQVDLIIADILMPEISGPEMLQRINELGSYYPCIFLTSSQRRDVGIEAIRLGAFDFIEKPLTRERIEDPIRKAIAVARAYQKLEWETEPHPLGRELLIMRAMRYQDLTQALPLNPG